VEDSMKRKFIFVLTISIIFALPCLVLGWSTDSPFPYVVNGVTPDNWYFNIKERYPRVNIPQPAKGVPIQDPNYHTTITRVTDFANDILSGGRKATTINAVYSTMSSSNADDTYFLVQDSNAYWDIYKGPNWPVPSERYTFVRTLNIVSPNPTYQGKLFSCSGSASTPIWDGSDPNIIYGIPHNDFGIQTTGPKLFKINVATGVETIEHDFATDPLTANFFNSSSGYPVPTGGTSIYGNYIYTGEYGSPDLAKRYWGIGIYGQKRSFS